MTEDELRSHMKRKLFLALKGSPVSVCSYCDTFWYTCTALPAFCRRKDLSLEDGIQRVLQWFEENS
jgi:hypothetical protein